ncbi:MAG: beta strand repeat-containing protein, partial [Bacteroidota bacterium]
LDPNSDGYVSTNTNGFNGNDQLNNELPWQTLIPAGTEPNSDVQNGPNCGFTDFVESSVGGIDPVFHLTTGGNWLFRFRMASIAPNAKSYSVMVDIDNLIGPGDDCYIPGVNPGFELEIVLATKFGVRIYDHRLPCGSNLIYSYGPERIQKSIAASTVCSQLNFFLETYVSWADITAQFGVNPSTPMRYAIVDNMAADKSTICNPSSASDIGGVDDNACGSLEACFTQIVNLQPPCPPNSISPCIYSACPVISGTPISAGATSISGTSTEANGTVIRVYVNGVLAGSGSVTGGSWTVSGLAPLASGAQVSATAQATGEVESGTNCNNAQVAGATCTDPPTNIFQCNAGKAFRGTAPTGSIVRLYDSNGVLQVPTSGTLFTAGTPNTITANGVGLTAPENFLWKCSGTGETSSCTAGGGPCINDGNYYITAQLPGQCESSPVWFCLGLTGSTSVPNIITAITSSTLTVTGNLAGNIADNNGVSIYLYVNSSQVGTATTTNNTGDWTINVPAGTFSPCDEVYVVAAKNSATALCPSLSSVITVTGGVSTAPVINQPICGTATTVSGTSSESNGSTVTLYQGTGTATVLGTATVSGGIWEVTGLSLAPGTTITARVQNTGLCESQSAASTSVTIGSLYANTATITPNPVLETSLSVSGTGTPGDIITLFNDGWPVYLNFIESAPAVTTVNGSGNWTITLTDAGIFYAGGTLTITSSSGSGCPSSPLDQTPIICAPPNTSLTVNPDAVSICTGSAATNIQIVNSQSGVIYQLFNNALGLNTGNSVLGNGNTLIMSTAILSASTTISVVAIKSPYNGSCNATLSETVTVSVLSAPTITLGSTTNPSTCGGNDGSIIVNGLFNNTNYTVSYTLNGNPASVSLTSNSSGSITISGLSAGTYTNISATSSGCSSANSLAGPIVLIDPTVPNAPVIGSTTQPTCILTTGSVSISGLPSGNWVINPGSISGSGSTTTISNLIANNTYNFTVTNSLTGCVSSASASVVINSIPSPPAAPTASVTTQPTCAVPTGTITVTAPSGANIVYSVDGTNYQASGTFSSLAPGSYNVTARDNSTGCTSAASVLTVNTIPGTPATPTAGITVQPTCAVPVATIVITAPSGSNISYSIDGVNYQSSGTFTNVAPGITYSITAFDNLTSCVSSPPLSLVVDAAPNCPPVANNNTTSTNEDTPVTVNVSSNDTDSDGTINAASVDLDPTTPGQQTTLTTAEGTWTVDASGNVTFTPAANFNGTATATYTVNDNSGATSNTATITVTVNP